MNRQLSTGSRKAFTLLELLLVMVIIAILAALFLPVLSKAKGRGKQIECLSQLKQLGLAAQQFTHDHGGRFPFQVPVKEGGTLELVQAAGGLGDVQYAFRHFQALSNDLEIPKLLGCPADRRITTNAVTFSSLRNEHISYFIAVSAEYSRPDSLLAGDRNIIAGGGESGSILRSECILRIAADTEVAWTSECHEYKGNLLFAGGHVERTGNVGLKVAMQNPIGPVNAWIPTASSSGSASALSSGSGGSVAGSAGGAGPASGAGGTGGSKSSGNSGAGSSGFAALQNFFQSPQGSGQATPVPPPTMPAGSGYSAAPERTPVEQPFAASSPPASEPRTNRVAAVTPLPVLPPSAETGPEWRPEPPPGVLAIFVEPERCWWCWILFLVVCVAAAVTLGVLIQQRQQRRLRAASATDPPDS